jgi:hypothetical protein
MTATIYGRHHYLFLHRCGCPFGLVEATRSALTEDGAVAAHVRPPQTGRHRRQSPGRNGPAR